MSISNTKMQPSTINECIDILAYNENLWHGFAPHHKDRKTVISLSESTYPWTEKQAKLAVAIIKRYKTLFSKFDLDIDKLCTFPKFRDPFRVIDYEKSIEQYTNDDNEEFIEFKFPYNKKIINLIRCLRSEKKGLPDNYLQYDGDKKIWTAKVSDVTVYYLTLLAIRYDFKFITPELVETFYEIRQEINYKKPIAKFINNEIKFFNTHETFNDYWNKNYKNKSLIQQIDSLKLFDLEVDVPVKDTLSYKIAKSNCSSVYINKDKTNLDQLLASFDELDLFPILIPVTGRFDEEDELDELFTWINAIKQRYDIKTNVAFGFDIEQPKLPETAYPLPKKKYRDEVQMDLDDMEINGTLPMEVYKNSYDLYLYTKSNKWIGDATKFIFVRNRIPRTLIKSGIKPKTALMSIGGGLWSPYSELIQTMVENCNKRVYYSSTKPIEHNVADIK